ncbi:MAG: hypothetical protein A4E27_00311 [Methanobacterium sp. PtaU1.Bin242]|nr:MAG: hypothetical protein A4E27_00311 [Methanobacterium sp. PtaU1.Bin242]
MKIKSLIEALQKFPEDMEVCINLHGNSEEFGTIDLLQVPIANVVGMYSTTKDRTTKALINCHIEQDILNNGFSYDWKKETQEEAGHFGNCDFTEDL